MGTSHTPLAPGADDVFPLGAAAGLRGDSGGRAAEPCAGWRAERRGLRLELAVFGPLCNAGQLEGFTFQRGKENMKN